MTFGLQTVLLITVNEILIPKFPGYEKTIGLMVSLGFVGSIFCNIFIGKLLDQTYAFKRITIATTGLSCLLSAVYSSLFHIGSSFYSLFVIYILLVGVFTTYSTVSFEHVVELTYPISEAFIGIKQDKNLNSYCFSCTIVFLARHHNHFMPIVAISSPINEFNHSLSIPFCICLEKCVPLVPWCPFFCYLTRRYWHFPSVIYHKMSKKGLNVGFSFDKYLYYLPIIYYRQFKIFSYFRGIVSFVWYFCGFI